MFVLKIYASVINSVPQQLMFRALGVHATTSKKDQTLNRMLLYARGKIIVLAQQKGYTNVWCD